MRTIRRGHVRRGTIHPFLTCTCTTGTQSHAMATARATTRTTAIAIAVAVTIAVGDTCTRSTAILIIGHVIEAGLL